MNVPQGIALLVLPRPEKLHAVACVRGERNAPGLVAAAERKLKGLHRVETRIDEQHFFAE